MPKPTQNQRRAKPVPDRQVRNRPAQQPVAGDHPVEQDLAVERGERIATGKTIARGGKETGHVPGATEQTVKPG